MIEFKGSHFEREVILSGATPLGPRLRRVCGGKEPCAKGRYPQGRDAGFSGPVSGANRAWRGRDAPVQFSDRPRLNPLERLTLQCKMVGLAG
jgi:hypothetical protein